MPDMRLKKIVGGTLLMALIVAPLILATRPAVAVPEGTVCYVGKIGRPLGIVITKSPELADLLVRARIATYDWSYTGRTFRGYDVCQPLRKNPF